MELNKIKSYIFKNLYTGILKTSLTLILSIVAIPLTIKNIGIDTYGIISIVLVFSSFTGALDLGLSKSLISLSGNEDKNSKEISAIYILNTLLFIIIFSLALFVYFFNINILANKNLNISNDSIRLLNSIALLLLAFGIVNNLLRASLEANFKLHFVNWGFLIQSIIINLGWLFLSIIKADINTFLIVPIISSIATLAYHLIFLPSINKKFQKPDKNSFKNVLGITFKFFKVGFLNSMHLPLIKYAIILFIGEGHVIGIFELATKLPVLANNILAYISNPFFSIVANHKEKNMDFLWKNIKKTTKFLAIISIIGYLFFFFFNKLIISYFFNEYSEEIFRLVNMVLIAYLFVATSETIQKFFLGLGEINLVARIKFLSILINIVILTSFYNFGFFNLFTIGLSYSTSLVLLGCYWLSFFLKKKSIIIAYQ